ncbi:tetratricopeptide repeat protein [Mycobacterium sp. pR1184]|uniref:tetratricopeptide repeat protein n=1 Tax=Mycobacterium sp. pR1184 TaxID=3238981 RepID=UPI00351BE84D
MPSPEVDPAQQAGQLADAYAEAGNYQRAREVLGQLLSQNPNDPVLLAGYARAEYMLGNYPSAARSAYAALGNDPLNAFAVRIYALSLDELGRNYDARWVAYRGVLAHPNDPLQHRVYARLLHNSRQHASALWVVDEALRLDPASTDALILRGSILHDLDRIDESDTAYGQALTLSPGNAQALNNLAVNRLRRYRFGRALRGFLGAAGSDPELGDLARRNIAVVLRKVFRLVSPVAAVVSFLVALTSGLHGEGHSTASLRVVLGLLTAVLVGVLGWLIRTIPHRLLRSVLRGQYLSNMRLGHAVLAAAAGAWTTVWPVTAGVAVGGILTLTGLLFFRMGLYSGR